MKQIVTSIAFVTFLICIILPKFIFSQSENIKDLNINVGTAFNISVDGDNEFQYCGLVAPSLCLGRHEFLLGALINERTDCVPFKPSIGGIIGYKYFVDKNLSAVRFYLNFSFMLQRLYDYYYHTFYSGPNYTNPYVVYYSFKDRIYSSVFGYGLNFYPTKKRNFYFFQTTGYSIMLWTEKSYADNKYFDKDKEFSFKQIVLTAGLIFKLKSF